MFLFILVLVMIFLPILLFRVNISKDGETVLFISVAATVTVLIFLIMLSGTMGFDFFDNVEKSIESLVDEFSKDKQFLKIANIDNMGNEETRDYLSNIFSYIIVLSLGLFAILESMIIFGMYSFISSINHKYKRLKHIRYFKISKKMLAKLVFVVFASFIAFKLPSIESEVLFASSLLFVAFILSIQGISLLFMYAHKKKLSSYFAGIVAGLSFFSLLGFSVLSFFGLLDIVFDLKDKLEYRGGDER